MPIGPALALFLLLMLVALLPVWPWSRSWSYRPAMSFAIAFTVVILGWVTLLI